MRQLIQILSASDMDGKVEHSALITLTVLISSTDKVTLQSSLSQLVSLLKSKYQKVYLKSESLICLAKLFKKSSKESDKIELNFRENFEDIFNFAIINFKQQTQIEDFELMESSYAFISAASSVFK